MDEFRNASANGAGRVGGGNHDLADLLEQRELFR